MKFKSEKFWDFISTNYDNGSDNPSERRDFAIARKYLQASDRVLDYACGTGTLSIEIAGQVKEIHALDISSKMLAAAERKAAARKIENIHFVQTTLWDERYPPGSFDGVMAFNILHLLEDMRQAVQRVHELLKPGGYFISTTPCLGEKMEFSKRLLFPLFLLPSKLKIIPTIKVFEKSELESVFAGGNFQIVEAEDFDEEGTLSDFIVARKIGGLSI
jgi:ubiquinone/menaquinone biosynthesis C-methylase UbiE